MTTTTINLSPSVQEVARLAIAMIEGGTPEGKKGGRTIVFELANALEAAVTGEAYTGTYISMNRAK